MSHFSVLVITDSRPNEEDLARVLQPWHEYECTGIDDEYVVDVDVTDQVMDQFRKSVDAVDKARGKSIGYATPADCARDYFGACERSGRFYCHTNPNRKWDWWVVGGRFTGLYSTDYDPAKDPHNQEVCSLCKGTGRRDDDVGRAARAADPSYRCNGCMGRGMSVKFPTKWAEHSGDQFQVRALDSILTPLRERAEDEAGRRWDTAEAIVGPHRPWRSFRELLEEYGPEQRGSAQAAYWEQPAMQAFHAARSAYGIHEDNIWLVWARCDSFLASREEYVREAGQHAGITFAVVHDGKWYERGSVGWWGSVSNEQDPDDWAKQWHKVVRRASGTAWATVVDCHI